MAETNHGTALLTLKPLMPKHISDATLKAAIEGWTDAQRQEAIDWAAAIHAKAETIPPRPKHCDGFFLIEREVEVMFPVYVTIDVSKFTPEFMERFNASMHDFGDSLDEHFKYLAEMHVMDNDSGWPDYAIEGYGPAKDMGISFDMSDPETDFAIGG